MKGKHYNKITHRIRKWRLGNDLRQFIIIVAGVLVTFYGNDLITNHAKQKEVTAVMQFVKLELEQNEEKLREIEYKISMEQQMSVYLLSCDFDVRKLPVDTLQKYRRFISSMSSFEYTSDAMEVLKSSSLMQQVNNKKLLLDLVKTYDALRERKEIVASFYKMKENVLVPIHLSRTAKERKILAEGNIYMVYEMVLQSEEMQNFAVISEDYFGPNFFTDMITLLNNSIETLSKQYPSRD